MASFEKVYYCKNCKKNVSLDETGHCKHCGGNSFNISWSARFRFVNSNGIEIQKRLSGFETKKEGQNAVFEFNVNNPTTNKKIKKNLTFTELYNEYAAYLKTRTKPSTHYDFVSKSKKLLDYFGKSDVAKITPKQILDWQNTLTNYSYNYKCHLRTCLSGLLRYAEKYYDIPNQLRKVDGFRNLEPKHEMLIWTPEEFEAVMKNVLDFTYQVFYTALYLTGARKGEMLATYWSDWDLKNKTLNINKSISKKVTGASWMVTSPKNASSVRKIKINDNLSNMIQKLHEVQKQNNTLGQFVFGGTAPLPETCICRYLTNAAQKANIKVIRVHDLRHSHASLLISQGASIVAVAKRLGHSSIEQTLNTYAHLMPNEEEDLINKLQSSLKKTT